MSDITIPPVAKIENLLAGFEERVPVWGITVFTVDGYIIAHRLFYNKMPPDIEMAVSSLSASLITIAENFIGFIDPEKVFRQITFDAMDDAGGIAFTILLKQVADNVLLTCIFPSSVQLGLVVFELETLSDSIVETVNEWEVKLHEETMT
ncbi:MAG: hypothetical protein GF411_05885 [Candidatus Lokiarchaeota archaeon]|nr:hypothetical protein [Candidatus Lokiarchaeota archaeon]